MSEYVDEFESVFALLEAMESPVPESMQIAILFASFGSTAESSYGAVVTALQTMGDDDLNWERATARLLQEYSFQNSNALKGNALNSEEHAIQQKALKSKAHVQCYGCGKYGHFRRECRSTASTRLQEKQSQGMHSDKRVNFSVDAHQKALLSRSETKALKPIVLDSGASCHMMADSDLFESLHDARPRTITLRNGSKLLANKMGSVIIKTATSGGEIGSVQPNRVLFVPKLDTILVSCAAIDMDGYCVHFEDGACHILRDADVSGHGHLQNGLYVLHTSVDNLRANLTRTAPHTTSTAEELWHRRFGHASIPTLKSMARRGTVSVMRFTDMRQHDASCVLCLQGKKHV